jgi:hypothetical protein
VQLVGQWRVSLFRHSIDDGVKQDSATTNTCNATEQGQKGGVLWEFCKFGV